MKKPGIPPTPKKDDDRARFDSAVKESLEVIMGRTRNTIADVPDTATTADLIVAINAILRNLQ